MTVRQGLGGTVGIWLIDIRIERNVPLWRRISRPPVILTDFGTLFCNRTVGYSIPASVTCRDEPHDAQIHERVDKHDDDRN